MRVSRQEPGLLVSGIAHVGLLVAGLVVLAAAPPFEDHEEAIAVDLVSDVPAMTRGQTTAKDVQPEPKPRVDTIAAVASEKPDPGEAREDVPAPPLRPAEIPPQETVAAPPPPPEPPKEPPQEPEPKAAETPPQPAPVSKREPKAAETPPKPEPVKDAEPKPEPPPKPAPFKEAEPKPEPPKRPEPRQTAERLKPVRKPEPKLEPKPEPKPKPEPSKQDLAKLIEEVKPQEAPSAKPAEPENRFSLSEIRKFLEGKERPQAAAATGQEVNRTAALGTRSGSAQKLSPAQEDHLGSLIKEQLIQCWLPPPGLKPNPPPTVRMKLRPDGSLMAEPELANSSRDPNFRPVAESALRAVRKCAPFRIPAQYAPFYADWQDWKVNFDPKDFLS